MWYFIYLFIYFYLIIFFYIMWSLLSLSMSGWPADFGGCTVVTIAERVDRLEKGGTKGVGAEST